VFGNYGIRVIDMQIDTSYDDRTGEWELSQFIDIDEDNFIAITINDDGVEVDVDNWDYENKHNSCMVNLI